MKIARLVVILLAVVLGIVPLVGNAQTGTTPLGVPIHIGEPQSDTIDEVAPFDWWLIDLAAGQQIRVVMSAADGLAPLIGILTPDMNLAARSDDGLIDGSVMLDFTAPIGGEFVIVAARVGIESGTTAGSYTIRVDSAGQTISESPYGAVTFRCNEAEADTVTWIRFQQPTDEQIYRVRIFASGGLQPVIKVETSRTGDVEPCIAGQAAADAALTVPGDSGTLSITEGILLSSLDIDAGASLGEITITFGALNDTSGRFLALIDGFHIDPAVNTDAFDIRNGPLAARDNALFTYMVRTNPTTRLDPFIVEDLDAADWTCDDAGRRGCEGVSSAEGVGVQSPTFTLIGARFDAGYRIETGDLDLHSLLMGSRSGRTTGDYALLLIGGLSARVP